MFFERWYHVILKVSKIKCAKMANIHFEFSLFPYQNYYDKSINSNVTAMCRNKLVNQDNNNRDTALCCTTTQITAFNIAITFVLSWYKYHRIYHFYMVYYHLTTAICIATLSLSRISCGKYINNLPW